MKLINNTLLAFTAEGVANSLALAGQLGLDTPSVVDAFAGSPIVSQWTAGKLRRLQDGDYSPRIPSGSGPQGRPSCPGGSRPGAFDRPRFTGSRVGGGREPGPGQRGCHGRHSGS